MKPKKISEKISEIYDFRNIFQYRCKLEKISEFFSKNVEIGVHGTGARKNFRKNFKKSMTL